MAYYSGRLQGRSLEPTSVTLEIADSRLRIVAGHRKLGSWPLSAVAVQRTSVYRFTLWIDGGSLEFFAEDPLEFSDEVGAVIDLTAKEGRYGLKASIQDASDV